MQSVNTLYSLYEAHQHVVTMSGNRSAHGTNCQYLLGLSDAQVMPLNFTLVNSAVTKLLYRSRSAEPGKVSLNYLNNYAHLEQQGEAKLITYR